MGVNYFKLFDLEQKYDIDLALLHKQYLQKQVLHHPDRANADADRVKTLEISMQLNEGYKILKDDFLRAEHLLQILGQKFDDQELKSRLDPEVLEEIIESHEMLEAMGDIEDLKSFKRDQLKKKTRIVSELAVCLKEHNIRKALEISMSLKYLTNLVRNIDLKIKHADSRD